VTPSTDVQIGRAGFGVGDRGAFSPQATYPFGVVATPVMIASAKAA
jgi:hypothetical protein